ncbi:hypothetical protein [Chengkuizengella sediminis]|uniref:hypothetical protein n=1 Tax=Chengkuizengella sediminis TaxID=1885917 RepID=UPI00138997F6|nr:hypothetical protein [Chengkuizengella sediminis]NDI33721.1 hypothetical protein [Chengkuizengella sediminis]
MDFKFIIAIIAFFVISNLFRKLSKQVQTNRMPTFGGSDDEGPMNLEPTEIEHTIVMEERKNEKPIHSFNSTNLGEHKVLMEKYQTSSSGFGNEILNNPSITPKKKNEVLEKKGLNPNQAIQGMMWSEVFGPPRAKKTYRYPQK